MTEIKIEKKKPIWPWIIGLLILGLLLYFFVFADKDENEVVQADVTNQELVIDDANDNSEIDNNEISTFREYIENPNMGIDHEYTNGAIAKLIDATRAVATDLNVDVSADLDEANSLGDEITKDPTKLDHADKIKNSAKIIAKALKTIISEKAPNLQSELKQVENSIAAINPDVKTLEQKNEIKAFFENSGNLLTSLKNNYGQ